MTLKYLATSTVVVNKRKKKINQAMYGELCVKHTTNIN